MARTATRVNAKQFSAIRKALKDTAPKDVAAFYGVPVAAVKRVAAAKSWADYGTKSIKAAAPKVEKANKKARKALRQLEGEHLATPAPKMTRAELQLANNTINELNARLTKENTALRAHNEFLTEMRAIDAKQPWYKRLVRVK